MNCNKKIDDGGIDAKIDVNVHLGNRFCTEAQKEELMKIVQSKGTMIVTSITSDVVSVEQCEQMVEQQEVETFIGIVRSGQTIYAKGDILIIGDVNPNGKVTAVGSIYVLGKLKGMVHAGVEGNQDAIVAASTFEATHVAIANTVAVSSNEDDFFKLETGHVFAYLNDAGAVVYDRIQEVRNIRPSLSVFKGGS